MCSRILLPFSAYAETPSSAARAVVIILWLSFTTGRVPFLVELPDVFTTKKQFSHWAYIESKLLKVQSLCWLILESSAPPLNPSAPSASLYFPLKAPLRAASVKATHPLLSQLLTGKAFYTFCSSFFQVAAERSDSQALRTGPLLPNAFACYLVVNSLLQLWRSPGSSGSTPTQFAYTAEREEKVPFKATVK